MTEGPKKITRKEAIDNMPQQFESEYQKFIDGMRVVGIYDGLYEIPFTPEQKAKMDPTDTRTHGNAVFLLREGLKEGDDRELIKFWASNGLVNELELQEVNEGDNVEIRRKGSSRIDTRYIVKFVR